MIWAINVVDNICLTGGANIFIVMYGLVDKTTVRMNNHFCGLMIFYSKEFPNRTFL